MSLTGDPGEELPSPSVSLLSFALVQASQRQGWRRNLVQLSDSDTESTWSPGLRGPWAAESRGLDLLLEQRAQCLIASGCPSLPSARPESYSKDEELASTLPEGEQPREGEWRRRARPLRYMSGLSLLLPYSAARPGLGPLSVLTGDREALWAELKAGAESGWDFSSRWLVGSSNPNSLSSTQTSKWVPVDLNAFLCQAEELMSSFYSRLGEPWGRAPASGHLGYGTAGGPRGRRAPQPAQTLPRRGQH